MIPPSSLPPSSVVSSGSYRKKFPAHCHVDIIVFVTAANSYNNRKSFHPCIVDTRDTLSQEMCPISWLPSMESVCNKISYRSLCFEGLRVLMVEMGLLLVILAMLSVREVGKLVAKRVHLRRIQWDGFSLFSPGWANSRQWQNPDPFGKEWDASQLSDSRWLRHKGCLVTQGGSHWPVTGVKSQRFDGYML